MELSAAFRERLEHMEQTRNQRLSLLQAEKNLQASKSMALSSKLANIRSMEQRCSLLDLKVASQNFKICRLKSEIERLDAKYESDSQQLRVTKMEAEELEELEKERNKLYDSKGSEMREFRQRAERFGLECKMRVQELRNAISEMQESFEKFRGNHGSWSDSEIGAAERRKSQLLDAKEDLDRNLGLNYQMRAQLQMELQTIVAIHSHPRK
ncbi:hypothetical protein FNV43_RR06014 [Rhamnella rubrinervis]|uniref:Uncharacterized protein n=1 Tax=Rhamnella rubrinervis TaxID=2594499 RepID=A0A8K0HCT3_9ROSA|nr:hypothetical protein FNV43_RR06014 [Rhamnella rubrinervis]